MCLGNVIMTKLISSHEAVRRHCALKETFFHPLNNSNTFIQLLISNFNLVYDYNLRAYGYVKISNLQKEDVKTEKII